MDPASLRAIFGVPRQPRGEQKPRMLGPSRRPLPIDPGRPSLIALPDDIILQILNFVQTVSPKSVLSLACVSSYFYHHARYVQHRSVSIDLDKLNTVDRLDFISRNSLLPAIRILQVRSAGRPDGRCLSCLSDVITGMTGLHHIHWEGIAIGEAVLQSLQEHPRVQLHALVIDRRGRDPRARQLLASLAGSTLLSSVRAEVTYFRAEDCMEVTQPLKKLLLSCPNLRKLSLNIDLPRQGCVMHHLPNQYCGLGLTNGERPPPLEELQICNYPWGRNSGGSLGLYSVGYPEAGLEMDYWANTFDWSRLCRLDTSVMFAHTLMRKLTALKHVRFARSWNPNRESTQQFFEQVPSTLESICIPTLGCVGITAIARHGLGLRKLEIHQEELSYGKWKDGLITDQDLAALRDALPHLEELAIDVDRDGDDWPRNTLGIVAEFPSLKLWFGLGEWMVKPAEPYLTMASASELFRDLRRRSNNKSLRRLHVFSGCPPPLSESQGLLTEAAEWPQDNSTSFVCEMAERDDDVQQGLFSVICPKLSEELNNKMERVVRREEERSHAENNMIDFKVALDGPIRLPEWLNHRRGQWPIRTRDTRRT